MEDCCITLTLFVSRRVIVAKLRTAKTCMLTVFARIYNSLRMEHRAWMRWPIALSRLNRGLRNPSSGRFSNDLWREGGSRVTERVRCKQRMGHILEVLVRALKRG